MKKAFIISLGCEDRLKIIRKVLKDQYTCRIFISDFDHAKKEYIEVKDMECEYVHVPKYKKNLSYGRVHAYGSFARQIRNLLEKEKPELIYVMLPPNIIAFECGKYKQRYPTSKLIVDVYDLWPESFPIQSVSRYIPHILTKWKSYRTKALKLADYIFTECNYYQKVLGDKLVPFNKTSVLYIHKEQSSIVKEIVEKSIKKYKKDTNVITLGYLGSINNIIDIEGISSVIESITLNGINVKVKIIGGGEGTQRFVKKIVSVGAQVENYGFMFDEIRKAQILSTCDWALNMMVGNISVGLTTKSVDYLSLALPIINNIKGDTKELVKSYNIGVNYYGDSEQILKASEADLISMKENAYKCYQDMMTAQGLYSIVHTAFENNGIL